ncbi:MAG: hypothetical protein V5A76_00865 [Candidatus Thermoplasmatota archaeon]
MKRTSKGKTWTVRIVVKDGWPLIEMERWSARTADQNSREENWLKRSVNAPSKTTPKKPTNRIR